MTTYKPGPDNLAVLILNGPSAGAIGRTTGEVRGHCDDYPDGRYVQVVCEDRVAWVGWHELEVKGVIEAPAPLLAVVGVRERVRTERAA